MLYRNQNVGKNGSCTTVQGTSTERPRDNQPIADNAINFTRGLVNPVKGRQCVIIPGIGQQRLVESQRNPTPQVLPSALATGSLQTPSLQSIPPRHIRTRTPRWSIIDNPSHPTPVASASAPAALPCPFLLHPSTVSTQTFQPLFPSCLRCIFLFFCTPSADSSLSHSGSSTRQFFHSSPRSSEEKNHLFHSKKNEVIPSSSSIAYELHLILFFCHRPVVPPS